LVAFDFAEKINKLKRRKKSSKKIFLFPEILLVLVIDRRFRKDIRAFLPHCQDMI